MSLEMLLIRHGDADYDNDCLTSVGVWQAECLARLLDDVAITEIYVSPMGRARETGSIVAKRKSLAPVTLAWLEDVSEGLFPTTAQFLSAPELSVHGATAGANPDFGRVESGIERFLSDAGYIRDGERYRIAGDVNKRVALFCHRGVIQLILSRMLTWSQPAVFVNVEIDPTGLTRLVAVEHHGLAFFKAVAINERSHLPASVRYPPVE